MIDEDTWAINVQYAPTDTEFIKYATEIANATTPTAPVLKIPLKRKPYDIAASCPKTHHSRPLFNFRKEAFHPSYIDKREIPREKINDALHDALKLLSDQALAAAKATKHIQTGLLRDSLIHGHSEYKQEIFHGTAKNVTISGHNHDGPKAYKITEEIRQEAARRYVQEGLSMTYLAHRYGVSRSTIHRWIMKYYA